MKNNWQKDIHDRLGNYEKDAPKDSGRTFAKERLMRMVAICTAVDLSKPTGYGAQRILLPLQAWLC